MNDDAENGSIRDKGEEFEHLKPEDGFAGPPWKK